MNVYLGGNRTINLQINENEACNRNFKLLEAVQVLLQVAVMHYPGHQKEDTEVARGNNLAEWAAKEAAKGMFRIPLVPVLDMSQFDLEYSNADLEKAKG